MFDDTKLDRPLTRKDLDEATTEHPVSVAHRGGHTNFYNSKAFELAGHHQGHARSRPTAASSGTNGELNGRVAENARDVFNRVGKRETFTPEQRRDRARNGMRAHVEAVQRRRPHLRAQRRHVAGPHPRLRGLPDARRADAPRLHDDPLARGLQRPQGREHPHRLRRRVDPRRRRQVRRRRLRLRADDAHEHAVRRHRRLRHPDDDAGAAARSGGRRAQPRLPGRACTPTAT